MTHFADVRAASAPPPTGGARGLIRWVCTSNPFYVLSAALFLAGLWISFGGQTQAEETVALMSGLAGYTLLLAGTAFLLVRFCRVWDDVRTVLLLVVLMFLATSVTLDEVLVLTPGRGRLCYLGGLLFAVLVSEGLLRGIRLRLPAWFRAPYYLILGLFFLYPLALSLLLGQPGSQSATWGRGEALTWGLFGFSPTAGLIFLTLLPAIRRGPDYVRCNGSPWCWPLYPWVLFGVLGLAVVGRAYLLCWSMHLLGLGQHGRLIFGPYFLIPFGLAITVLLLEIGLVSRRLGVLGTALAAPVGLVYLSLVGHRLDPIYQGFLAQFTAHLGGDPLFLTLLAAAGFYAYAALRGVGLATEALTAALVALAFVGPDTLQRGQLLSPLPAPILAAAALQLGLGLWRRRTWRCLIGGVGVAASAMLVWSAGIDFAPWRAVVAFHLALSVVLLVGALSEDALARALRLVGAVLGLLACAATVFFPPDALAGIPAWALEAYAPVMAGVLLGYALLLSYRPVLLVGGLVLAGWVAAMGWRGYGALRQLVTGLDYMALSLTLFALAILISLGKAGFLSRWRATRHGKVPQATD